MVPDIEAYTQTKPRSTDQLQPVCLGQGPGMRVPSTERFDWNTKGTERLLQMRGAHLSRKCYRRHSIRVILVPLAVPGSLSRLLCRSSCTISFPSTHSGCDTTFLPCVRSGLLGDGHVAAETSGQCQGCRTGGWAVGVWVWTSWMGREGLLAPATALGRPWRAAVSASQAMPLIADAFHAAG